MTPLHIQTYGDCGFPDAAHTPGAQFNGQSVKQYTHIGILVELSNRDILETGGIAVVVIVGE